MCGKGFSGAAVTGIIRYYQLDSQWELSHPISTCLDRLVVGGVDCQPKGTPCLKLGKPPKIPRLPALGFKLQGPKLKHPESYGDICWAVFEFLRFFVFYRIFAIFGHSEVLFSFFGGIFCCLEPVNIMGDTYGIILIFTLFKKFQFRPICNIFGQFAIFLALEVLGRPQGA